ncbi:MAG: efflux RND transporter periplasmic adaptor subunit [Armatimonadota bacterium]|nr:efflux RND transporter periplasmic adaptor subunit [Armatimonadota bacterium]MDR7455872.1 efflux RND transporter periplasmic adaptor subunit [Armatimonadota bacterium]
MRRWWVGLVVVVAALAAAGVLLGRGRSAAPASQAAPSRVPVEVAAARRADVVRAVEVSGTVTSARTASLYPKISGRVARVLVQDGARVAAGAALLELDASDQRAELRQAEAAVAAAEARLALLERGQRPQERQVVYNAFTQAQNQVKAAETQVAVSEAALRVAESDLRRQEALLREGAVAQAQVDQARLRYEQARAQVQAAQAQLEIARTAADSARQQWEMTQAGARDEDLAAARAQVAQARAVAAIARQRLAAMTIRAPFAGRVTGLAAVPGDFLVSGDFAGRGQPVAQVYDEVALEVEVTVGERDIGLVRAGQPAVVRLESAPETPVRAVVRLVSPAADPLSRAAAVRLRLNAPPEGATPGTFARGEIVVERRAGVVVVPRVAVDGGERPVVRVITGGVVQVRSVTLGLAQGEVVQVLSGVAEGEEVVVLGPEGLSAGTAVTVVNR